MTLANSYADYSDFCTYGIRGRAVDAAARDDIEKTLVAQSRKADSLIAGAYLGGTTSLPLVTWPTTLTEAVCQMAAFEHNAVRGFDLNGPDAVLMVRRDNAVKFLQAVGAKKAFLIGTTVNSPGPVAMTAVAYSDDPTGI